MKETFLLLLTAQLISDVFRDSLLLGASKRIRLTTCTILLSQVAMTLLGAGTIQGATIWVSILELLAIDQLLIRPSGRRLAGFAILQTIRIAILLVTSYCNPNLAVTGIWSPIVTNPLFCQSMMKLLVGTSSAILIIHTGSYVVQFAIQALTSSSTTELTSPTPIIQVDPIAKLQGLPNAGRIIGYLERALVMLLVWIDQPSGIGFLVTAKSILRFGDIKDSHSRRVTEYVMVGNLLSFTWAILIAVLARRAIELW